MQEVIIDHKKYISSKQAAEITGYAKDYIGQLCREGRVPARLIGRTWYVLESALQDHRFGAEEPKMEVAPEVSKEPLHPTWEAPRYKSESNEYFPSLNKLSEQPKTEKKDPQIDESQTQNTLEVMHGAWKDWFSRPQISATEADAQRNVEPVVETGAVQVPIHTIYKTQEAPKFGVMKKVKLEELAVEGEEKSPERAVRGEVSLGVGFRTLRLVALVLAVLSLLLGVLGLGLLDSTISSNTLISRAAGITIINNK